MPRGVAIGEYEPRISPSEGARRIIPSVAQSGIGNAFEKFGHQMGENILRVATSDAAAFSLKKLSEAQAQWTQELQARQESAPPGAPGLTPQLMKDYGDYVKKSLQNSPNKITDKFLTERLTEFGMQLQQRALNFEANARQSHNENVAHEAIDASGNELMNDPGVYTQRLAERQAMIDSMNLDPQVKEKLSEYAKQSMSKFAVMGDISRDPYAAMQSLSSADPQGYYAHLSPEMRTQLQQHADSMLHQRVADAERIETLQKKQEAEVAEGILRDGILKAQKGELTADWVRSKAPLLKPNELKFMFDELSGHDVKSDIHVYSDLLGRAGHGEDVSEEAKNSLFSGLLSKEDYTRIADMAAKDQPNWFKRGTEYITTMSGYSELNPNIDSAQMKARMIDQWNDWAQDHPKPSIKEAQDAYQSIVSQAMLVKSAGLPYLKYAQGSSLQPDLEKTKAATKSAYEKGEISLEDFNREALKISKWERTLAVQGGKPQ